MEQVKRKVNLSFYILAVVITLFIFISGFIIGDYVAYKKAATLDGSQKAISSLLKLSEIKGETLINETGGYCNLSWEDIWSEKVEIGEILFALERKLGKTNPEILEQKKIYNEVQYYTLKLVNSINERCGYNWTIIVFFYTNEKEARPEEFEKGELQGYVLDTLYERNPEKIKIFSFDIAAGDNFTAVLMERYDIKTIPSVIINGKAYSGLRGRNEIETILKE
jgi:hypothetical protein